MDKLKDGYYYYIDVDDTPYVVDIKWDSNYGNVMLFTGREIGELCSTYSGKFIPIPSPETCRTLDEYKCEIHIVGKPGSEPGLGWRKEKLEEEKDNG